MAHSRMPRCHATAWVSKPTTPVAPDPTRGGYSNSRAGPWHQDTPPRRPRRGLVTPVRQAKGVKTGSTQDRSPVVATEVARLHLPSPPDHAKRVQKPSGQIEAFDLARTRTPSSRHERKNQKTSCFTLILLTPEMIGQQDGAGRFAGDGSAARTVSGGARPVILNRHGLSASLKLELMKCLSIQMRTSIVAGEPATVKVHPVQTQSARPIHVRATTSGSGRVSGGSMEPPVE
jgi:hypothetical protein